MGAGIALQAKNRIPSLPLELGTMLGTYGNRVFYFPKYNIITFPTKDHWKQPSNLALIERSCKGLVEISNQFLPIKKPIYLPPPGCGNGGFEWHEVEPVLQKYLNDDFIVILNDQKQESIVRTVQEEQG